ncbi:hypothetical protein GCK72_010493 [Caenorhabditis remanei]|uniref:COMM domain-containing protein n=1 Tax=Caenorhabditis remanei TaxID=31234 RepID=A0A6A5H5L4_CAERE|nr:hypothetical protein GCK72_010493 [Caenorhabditis remanei]KAF1762231.1 hypothetical protein GCK72_010493 [Caenorhabditis remanei]
MFTEDQLSKLYDCATTSKRLPNEFADGEKDFKKLIQYGEYFKACQSCYSTDYIQKAADLNEEEKVQLKNIVTQKLVEASGKDDINWNVNIVIGNSHVAKSLRPIITIKMPTNEGETFEFDIDSFAQFRQQLASAVLAVNPQE